MLYDYAEDKTQFRRVLHPWQRQSAGEITLPGCVSIDRFQHLAVWH
jgi:hypothetical protein